MKQKTFAIAFVIIFALFILSAVFILTLPPRDITPKDIPPAIAQHSITKEPAAFGITVADSNKADANDKVTIDYLIIVGSYKDRTQAQHEAKRLYNEFNTDIVVLPRTKEGYYRIGYGKYSSLEEAESAIKNIKTNICPDAWIYSLKEEP
jgi:cell division protein FtsN